MYSLQIRNIRKEDKLKIFVVHLYHNSEEKFD